MRFLDIAVFGALACHEASATDLLHTRKQDITEACPDYVAYSQTKHPPYSEGPLKLSYQRPIPECRTFSSPLVEKVIKDITSRMVDKDLARIFENAFPNTLDTTVRWHVDGTEKKNEARRASEQAACGKAPSQWLRDSTNQLAQYQKLANGDPKIKNLILGAINTQAEFVIQSPYCNAFQPPPPSNLPPTNNGQMDQVHPAYEPSVVFECKYELDSIANFLSLGNQFYEETKSKAFLTSRWYEALNTVLRVLDEQSQPTFNENGQYRRNEYTFQRHTNAGTETLSLMGIGNPLGNGTGLVRSAFRPSDDTTILGFFIPANAMMSVELAKTAETLSKAGGAKELIQRLKQYSERIREGIYNHAVVTHKTWGRVFAFEVDGYGSSIFMDDANLPSLLALPLLGFVDQNDEVYKNTRKMILSKTGNPYYLTGSAFHGIGGPHIGLQNAWPMSVLVRARTANSDKEVMESINIVRDSCLLGLVHESVDVNRIAKYTRSWFAWANSVFAQTILDLAENKPHLIFGKGAKPYKVASDAQV
ncbi:meiotically up-regulated 157 protein [Nannizzia gypsea CBS 118893]|uniref:Meiotically up-regulated 157 protein n=1 Tax=Arthroderma gypseum (strain ATCC MYA-4604 / CBS 118893) TaxID=535722 RepID=E4V441_ARTGP|nr:meiotically up-regulated 157 protein [Nannizzia gypsea CBS 118893]EFR04765.1 meiotically up-regulated 157 protein [Nannizzia gypsea CBS 118893]